MNDLLLSAAILGPFVGAGVIIGLYVIGYRKGYAAGCFDTEVEVNKAFTAIDQQRIANNAREITGVHHLPFEETGRGPI